MRPFGAYGSFTRLPRRWTMPATSRRKSVAAQGGAVKAVSPRSGEPGRRQRAEGELKTASKWLKRCEDASSRVSELLEEKGLLLLRKP